MTSTQKWNSIVDLHSKHFNDSEQIIQSIWETVFSEIFGYSRLRNEIEKHRQIRLGSTERIIADIIIKNEDIDIFIVELKQHNMKHDSGMELQLLSYLKQLRLNTGILICDKIYIYDYDINKDDNEQIKAIIEIVKDNPNGVRFVEIFSKGSVNSANIKEFISLCNISYFNVEKIKDELTSDLVNKLLKEYFSGKYNEYDYEQAVSAFSINILLENSLIKKNALSDTARTVFREDSNIYKPTYEFVLNGISCDGKAFEEHLINKDSCSVNVTLFYHNRQEFKIWKVSKFTVNSNLKGNLASGFLRDWRRKGIVGIKLEI